MVKKLYKNTGVSQLIIGDQTIEPGDEFEAALDPAFEQQMFSGGHLTVKNASVKKGTSKKSGTRKGKKVKQVTANVPSADDTGVKEGS